MSASERLGFLFPGSIDRSVGPPPTACGVPGADFPLTAHWPHATGCLKNLEPRTTNLSRHMLRATGCVPSPLDGVRKAPERVG